jgi:hypothetical protein
VRTLSLPLAFILCMGAMPAYGWPRPFYEDAVVVERSELIVVAHVKKGSIQYVRYEDASDGGWLYQVTLVITEVLKGKSEAKEITLILHYGLTPIVGGYEKREDRTIDLRSTRKDYPKDIVEIFDTGSNHACIGSLIKDASEDNLWFLRRRSGWYGREPGTGNYGVVDPEDVQPLALKDYFLTYLSVTPEKAVREYVTAHPELARRTEGYFDHLEVQRILKLDEPKDRVKRLVPFFFKRQGWSDGGYEAQKGLVACGEPAGAALLETFDDPAQRNWRVEIMEVWREARCLGCVDRLIRLVKEHNTFWTTQDLKDVQGSALWWSADTSAELKEKRGVVYHETVCAIRTLGAIADPRARGVLEFTRDMWRDLKWRERKMIDTTINDECAAALEKLDRK